MGRLITVCHANRNMEEQLSWVDWSMARFITSSEFSQSIIQASRCGFLDIVEMCAIFGLPPANHKGV